jgi:hypothetical protein
MRTVYAFAEMAQAQADEGLTERTWFIQWAGQQVQTSLLESWMGSGEPSIYNSHVAVQPARGIVPVQINEVTV